jgi:hypothetical protein
MAIFISLVNASQEIDDQVPIAHFTYYIPIQQLSILSAISILLQESNDPKQ